MKNYCNKYSEGQQIKFNYLGKVLPATIAKVRADTMDVVLKGVFDNISINNVTDQHFIK